jgi:hypothetical protein
MGRVEREQEEEKEKDNRQLCCREGEGNQKALESL